MSRVIQERGLCVLTVKNRVPTLWRSRRLRLRSDVMDVDTAGVPSKFARALAFLAPTLALLRDVVRVGAANQARNIAVERPLHVAQQPLQRVTVAALGSDDPAVSSTGVNVGR